LNAGAVAHPSQFRHLCTKTDLTGRQGTYCLCYPNQAIFEPRQLHHLNFESTIELAFCLRHFLDAINEMTGDACAFASRPNL
jgi:hypothetical protein